MSSWCLITLQRLLAVRMFATWPSPLGCRGGLQLVFFVLLLQQDTTGLGVILLTSLTEEQWVEEDDMARKLNLPNKMVRKALRYLEQVRNCAGQ